MTDYEKKRREILGLTGSSKTGSTQSITATNPNTSDYTNKRRKLLGLETFDVDEKYISTFLSDAQSYLNGANAAYTGMGYANRESVFASQKKQYDDLRSRSGKIRAYLNHNRASMKVDDYTSFMAMLDDFDKSAASTYDAFSRKNTGISQFTSEYAYKEGMRRQEINSMSSEQIKAAKGSRVTDDADINMIQGLIRTNMPYSREHAEQDGRDMYLFDEVEKQRQYIGEKYGVDLYANPYDNTKILSALLNDEEIAYTTADGQNVTWDSLYNNALLNEDLASRLDAYSKNADWDEKSQGIDNVADTESDYQIVYELSQTLVPYDWDMAAANGVDRATFDEVEKKRQYISQKYGVDLHSDIYNNVHTFATLMSQLEGEDSQKDNFEYMSYLTDDEKAVLNYIYNTDGRAAALEWHNSRKGIYQSRFNNSVAMGWADVGKEHPFWGSVGSVALSLGSGVEYLTDIFTLMATGEAQDNTMARASSSIRSGVMEDVNWEIGNWDAFDFLYSTGMSMADSAASMALMGNLGGVGLGLGAAAQATNDALDRGMSQGQAFWNGIVSGTFEGLFENWSIGKFHALKEVASAHGKDIALNIAKSMLTNASEETLTEIANIVYDSIFNGDFSQYETLVRQYVVSGMTESEAKRKAALDLGGQVLESGASGALMGLGFGVIGSAGPIAKNTIGTAIQDRKVGKTIVGADGGVAALKALAMDVSGADASSKLTKQANKVTGETFTGKGLGKVAAAVKNSSNQRAVGKLYRSVSESTVSAQDQASIAKSLESNGFSAKSAKNIADALTAKLNGKQLTNFQKSTLESVQGNQKIDEIVKNLYSDENSPVRQRNQKLSDFALDVEAGRISKATGVSLDVAKEYVKGNPNAVKESLAESRYEVSAEGKTIDKDGNEIEITGVESVKDGKMILKTKDGTVDAAEVSFATEDEAYVYSAVSNMDVSAASAWALVKGFNNADGVSAKMYAIDIPLAYKYGQLNYKAGLQKLDLTPRQSATAFQMGREDAAAAVKDTAQAITEGTVSDKNAGKKVIFEGFTYNEKTAKEVQKASMAAIDVISKMTNLEIHVYQSYKRGGKLYTKIGGKERIAPNGYFTDGNKIYIDLNAGNHGEGMMLYTLSHEVGHYIAKWNAQDFKAISDFLFEHYGAKVPIDRLLEIQKDKLRNSYKTDGKEVPSEAVLEKEAQEELVCDMLSRMLADKNAYDKLMELKQKDLKLHQRLGQAIKKALDKLAKVLGIYDTQNPDFQYAASVESFGEEAFRQLQDLYMKAFVQADANYQAAEKNTTDDGGAKLQGRMTDADIKAVQGIGRISVNQFSTTDIKATERFAQQYWKEMGVKSPFFRAWFGDWRVNDQTKVQVANKKGDTRGVQKNTDTGWDIQVSGQLFAESKHFAKKNKSAIPYLPYINDIVEKAILLDSYGIEVGKAKSQNSLLMHSLYSVADIGQGPELLKLYIEEMNNPNSSNTAKRAYQLQNIEKASAVNGGVQGNSPSSLANTTNAIRTVADLFAAVKQKDADFKPNGASTVVNADGTPKVVYHGSAEQFNIFSYGHIGSASGVSILGDGFYFGDKKRLAKNYGENVYECYLQIKNPYKATEADAYKLNTKKLQEQGYDGVILESPSGKIYMVFDNTQIKSATDNIGTFDGSNPDIRYSDRDYSYEALTSKPDMKVTTVGGAVPNNRADVVFQAKQNAAKVGKFNPKDGSVSVHVDDIGADVILGTKGLAHGLRRLSTSQTDPTWMITLQAGAIIKNAIKINEVTPSKKEASGTYVLIGAAQNSAGDLYVVRFVVNQFSNELASLDVLYAINAKKEDRLRSMRPGVQRPVTDPTISIAELLDLVNQHFPDILPEYVLKHYGYDARPEGDLGEDALYQDRDTESVSNRSLLANALEGVVQNDIERKKLQEYRENITQLDAQEEKLSQLNAQIKELSFAPGKRDTAKIRQLRDEATMTANRIGIYDQRLLRLEASAPLQKVLEREKKKAYRRAEQKGKEALAAYRKEAAQQQKELTKKWQESRKKATESRQKTAVRHKIQSVVGELNQLLLRNDKTRHIPDSLKKAVADALSLVNMDTVGAEERAAKYADLIAKETDPDKIDAYTVTMENILRQGEKMGQRLKELRDAYEEIQNSDDPDIANAYDPVIAGALKELSQTIGSTSLRDMSIEQLEDVYTMYKMVLTRVRDANKTFLNARNESISELASKVVGEVRRVGGEHKYRASILDPVKTFLWNNLKPVYAMEHLGSETMIEAFNNLRKGEDTWAMDVGNARAYYIEKSKKYGYDSWDFDKKYTFESASGLEFDLTLEQILSLYAYSKREQAHDHLRLGGFVFDSNIETYKDRNKVIKYKVNTADSHQITPEILADITSTLTKEQIAFVDEMQDYLSSVMGTKGNEVTMAMYGVKLFKEKFYFPLKSAKQFMFEQNEVSGEVKIKNSGFTNKVVAKANNPVILSNFMDVWANHVNDMSMYHAFVLPLEDFNRIFNFNSPKQEGKPPVSVKSTIQSAYSPAAVNYVKQLITDLNGGAMSDPRETFAKKWTARFKKAKVFSSWSVVVQQPSAIGRAFSLVDPKFFHPTVDGMNHDQLWEELKQYAPVAVIKEMGYFDVNMGKSTQDFITAKEYTTFKEKFKAVFADGNYRDEVLSRAPALADELSWCAIWNAVKRETAAKHKDLVKDSEEFLKAAGERFTEVVTKTQVYDSVLSRSANMRSKSGLMSMATSFMAEPTTAINMLEDAIRKSKRGYKGYAARAFASVAVSVILNNALVSLIYGMRDDDEDETFAEKYMQSLLSNLLDDVNPLTYLPFLKDMWSLLQGYDVERSDMSLMADLADAMKKLVKAYTSEDGDVAGAWWDIAGSVANIGGIPMENIRRDVNGAINLINTLAKDWNGRSTTWGSMGDAVEDAVRDSLPVVGWFPGETKADKLYDAIIRGGTVYANRLKGSYKDQNATNNAIRKGLRGNDPRIREAAIAWNANDLDEYMRIAKEIIAEKHFVQDDVVMAIRSEASSLAPDDGAASQSKQKGLFTAEKFAAAVAGGDYAIASAAKKDIIETAKKNGKSEEEAEKAFISSAKTELKEIFLTGDISEQKAISALKAYCGSTQNNAVADVRYWRFAQDYPEVFADDQWFDTYYEKIAASGIDIKVYMNYRNKVSTITGENKKADRMSVINSLPISSAQKDALYLAEGWAKSKLYEAPWH